MNHSISQTATHFFNSLLMVNPTDPITTQSSAKQVRDAAKSLGMTFQTIEAAQADQIERAFSSIEDGVSGVMIPDDSLFFNERERIAEEALTRKIPTAVFAAPMVEDGGLMTYAPSPLTIFRRSAAYIVKILNGAKPDQLPVELPTTFEFVINLKTAKAIGLSISPAILNRADKVID